MEYRHFNMNSENELNKLVIDDTPYITRITQKFATRKAYTPVDPKKVYAVIPGIIQDIFVNKGQIVQRGDKLLIFEAMKMKNTLIAQVSGKVKSVNVQSGQMIAKGELLLEFE